MERVIGGNTFAVSPLPAMRAFALQARIAPALSALLSASGDSDVGAMVAGVAKALPAADLDAVTRELLQGATMDGMALFTAAGNPIDVKMQGRTLDVWKLILLALEVNYPDFFGALSGAVPGARGGPASAT